MGRTLRWAVAIYLLPGWVVWPAALVRILTKLGRWVAIAWRRRRNAPV